MTELHTIEKKDLFRLKFISEAGLSPDGKQVVYGITAVDAEKDEESAHLWIVSSDGGEPHQLTAGKGRDSGASWSPDGKKIAFQSTRDGAPQIYIIPVDGGEALQLTTCKLGVGSAPLWSPDGKFIAFTTTPVSEMPDYSKPYRVTRSVYRFNAMGYLDPIIQDVYVISVEGGEARQLTHDRTMNSSLHWSPDGQEILYSYNFSPDSLDTFATGLRLVNMQGETREVVPLTWGFITSAAWLPDGKGIAFGGMSAEKLTQFKTDLWVVGRHGGKPENRSNGFKVGLGGGLQGDTPVNFNSALVIPKDGKRAFVNVQEGGCVVVYEMTLSGAESYKPVLGGERSAALLGGNEKNLLLGVSTLNDPTNLVVCGLDGKKEKQITTLNQELLAGWELAEVEHILYPGSNGETVEGWYMKPTTGGQAPYPTILYVHGGPQGAFGYTFSFDFEMLAGAGYGVLFINPHGSTGYGGDFTSSINGDVGNLDYKDLMAGVDYVIEKGWADADKLGICGLSYGGYMTCWTVGQTDRFKAAVPENPVSNWISMYGVSDISADLLVKMLGGKTA